jgi:hypothetical protein
MAHMTETTDGDLDAWATKFVADMLAGDDPYVWLKADQNELAEFQRQMILVRGLPLEDRIEAFKILAAVADQHRKKAIAIQKALLRP